MANTYTTKQKAIKYTSSALAGLMALYSTGCASMNIKPYVSTNAGDNGLEAKAGIVIGADKEDNLCTILASPVSGEQWSNHPGRTAAVTGGYLAVIGAVVYALSGKSSGGSSTPDTTQPTNPNQPSNPGNGGDKPKPTDPKPTDPNGSGQHGDY